MRAVNAVLAWFLDRRSDLPDALMLALRKRRPGTDLDVRIFVSNVSGRQRAMIAPRKHPDVQVLAPELEMSMMHNSEARMKYVGSWTGYESEIRRINCLRFLNFLFTQSRYNLLLPSHHMASIHFKTQPHQRLEERLPSPLCRSY